MEPPVVDQVAQAANLLGLLLALDTLFTSEQARRLTEEGQREGGPKKARLHSIRRLSTGLAVVTAAAVMSLLPLVVDVLETVGSNRWQPTLAVFELTWLLLISLLTWQVVLIARSR